MHEIKSQLNKLDSYNNNSSVTKTKWIKTT